MIDVVCVGGAFDPPHLGHQKLVEDLAKKFPQVWVLPAATPVVAGGNSKKVVASFEDRFFFCQATFAHLSNVIVSDIESHSKTPNFTVETLKKLRDQNPGLKLGWAIGMDQLLAFANWRQPTDILQMVDLVVYKRAGVQVDPIEVATSMLREIGVPFEPPGKDIIKMGNGSEILFENSVLPDISSSRIRSFCAEGHIEAARPWVVGPVFEKLSLIYQRNI
jgi:nicotinate-nucleotide adenylyltransferase